MGRRICSRCIYDDAIPNIVFDEKGVCNYCHQIDSLAATFHTGQPAGADLLTTILETIKQQGHGRRYDCIVGVSGGTDSSFTLARVVEWGLRPLAVHYDNTWNTAIATQNIQKVTKKLNVDLFTLVVDNREADDLVRSFFYANVPDLDAHTDLALAETMYRAAARFGVSYVIEGHSFMAEGVSPLTNAYFDGQYILSVHDRFGRVPLKTFPNMTFASFMKWTLFKRIRKIRPLWYLNYAKEEARQFLADEFGWEYYGGHHLENRIAAFSHSYYLPRKFGIDQRNNSLSAAVRSGVMDRQSAIREYYETPPYMEADLLPYVKRRLGLSDGEFDRVMAGPKLCYKDYPTYKQRFERLRPMFSVLAKANLVPMSFYLKFCFPPKTPV